MNKKYSGFQKLIAGLLSIVMVLGLLPAIAFSAKANTPDAYISGTKKADPSTIDWRDYFGPDKKDTEFAGMVWSDKSVFTGPTAELPGITLKDSDNFLIALSAMASNMSITGSTSTPTDTMLVLDLSGSMVDGTKEIGYVRQGNNYRQVNGIDTDIIEALVDSTNSVIDSLMKQNVNNRVGVVLYSGNTSTGQAATSDSATVVLPLGRYTSASGEYLTLNAPTRTSTVYEWVQSGRWGSWQEAGQATYVPTGSNISVSVKSGIGVAAASKTVVGGTYIQNGLYKAMNEFLNVSDTTVPKDTVGGGAERLPVLVLMTDGAPTIATTDYTSIGNSNTGNGGSTNDRITFLTQLTAAYVRGKVAEHYQENSNDEANVLFLTLGLGTENSLEATNTLYPAGNSETLAGYWDNYLDATNGSTVDVISGSDTLEVTRHSAVSEMNYVDKYFYASDAQDLVDTFDAIVGEIELKAASYATLVTGGNADLSGYVTFEDELGELMEVQDMKGILLGSNYFSGMEISKAFNEGALGTTEAPTALGDELVRTVKERIPGLTTTQAQQLINQAFLDQQIYHADDNNWSNYIGWYADANGNYVGFWDKDVGYEAKDGAVYANKSYGYLGVNGDSDMMHVVVMVRTNLQTLHQTVYFKVPAALLPMVTYKITLAEDDPETVKTFERTGADAPIQLVFEVGLRSDINAVNLEAKVAEHLARGGHVHRTADGSIELFTNSWAIGNDRNGNGIPDPEEHDSAVVADAHFHPALENSRYYFTEDSLVLDSNGNPVTGDTRPSGTGYHHDYHIYNETGRTTVDRSLSATTLSKTEKNAQGQWYVPAGTAYRELPRMRNYKEQNVTGTLDYSDYPAIFADENIDVYNYLGNNGTVTIAPATGFALTKQVDGTIPGVSEYTFEVTLSDTAAQPVLTDSNGDALADVTMSAVSGGKFTVTMPAGVTAYISGIAVGTEVTVKEIIDGDYKVSGITVAGASQIGSAVFTVPAYGANVVQMVPVTFVNAPNGYGDLVIEKDVTHDLASDPEALAGKQFTFKVKLAGDKIVAGQTYATSAGTDVTVGNDGYLTTDIVLKNEESITIYDLPEGTIYTVTEQDLPGFQLDSINGEAVTQASGIISANEEKLAAFVNRYSETFTPVTTDLKIDITKVLTANSPYTGNEEFVFVLQTLLPNGTYATGLDVNDAAYQKVSANGTTTGTWHMMFYELGTYYLRIVELKPSEQDPVGTDTPGMDYSTMQALFEVNVTDVDMDGVLEVAVKEEAHIDISATYTDNDPEKITGIHAQVTFENIYEIGTTNTTLEISKTLNNETGVEKHLTDFHFTMYPADAQGNVAFGTQGTTVTASAIGEATFDVFLNTPGTFYYKVVEQIPEGASRDAATGKRVQNGMYYDTTEYLFTVTTAVNSNGDLEVTGRTLTNLTTGTEVSNVTASFVNDYILPETDPVRLTIRKNLTGRNPYNGEMYQMVLTRTNDSFTAPLTGADAWSETYDLAAGSRTVQGLIFEKAGSYHYTLVEKVPAGAVDNVYQGVRYDSAEYHITVTVSDNGSGRLVADMVMHKVGQTSAVTEAVFNNVYEITGSADVVIGGKKTLEGRMLYNGEFEFALYDNDTCTGTPIATVKNGPDGTFTFPALTFTKDDLDTDNGRKTHYFYVKEVSGNLPGVSYSASIHQVAVEVSHENGSLTATPSDGYNDLQFINYYYADSVQLTLPAVKNISGDWTNVPTGHQEFTFGLFETGEDFRITGAPVNTAYAGPGAFSFQLNYNDGQEGKYYYVLKERVDDRGGITYDAGEYHITVTVSDPGDGQLAATYTMYRPGIGYTEQAVFTNAYSVTPTTVTLEGNKTFTDVSVNQPKAMTDGQFNFLVLENGQVVATGTNKADGTIEFSPITYTAAGVHTYSVIEAAGNAGGVSYDDAVFTVTVTVSDDGQGVLTANVDYGAAAVLFENTYDPGMTSISLEGNKILNGRDLTAGAFTFEVLENGTQVATGTNDANGSIAFGAIEYTAAGVHTYTLREIPGTNPGITYDSATFTVVVTVVDNGDGTLTATADYGTTSATWVNTYTLTPTDIALEGNKILNGAEAISGEFYFEVLENGVQVVEGTNYSDGTVLFGDIHYTAAGVHTYTLREIPGQNPGMTYDSTTFTVVVTVVDNGDGTLTATADYGTTPVTWVNTYTPAPTNITLEGEKVLTGRDQLAGEFTFGIYENDVLIAEGVNKADGTIDFEKITYTAGGTHTYTVKEIAGSISGVTYDETVFTATVTVTDDGIGTLTATATYPEAVVFENTYTAAAAELILKAEKTLTGRDQVAGEFNFRILQDGVQVATGTNTADGKVEFSPLSFSQAGTYTYTVEEVKGNASHMTYDKTVHTVTVKVTDNGAGQLVAKAYMGDRELADNVVATFVNTYAPPSNPVTGDSMDPGLMIGITAFSGFAITALVVLLIADSKKRKRA